MFNVENKLTKQMNDFIKSDKTDIIVIKNNGLEKKGSELTNFFDIDFSIIDLKIGESVNDDYQRALKN